jgi:hypothetical protein
LKHRRYGRKARTPPKKKHTHQDAVNGARKQMTDRFDCDVLGNRDEYVGCRLERNVKERWIKFTQPVQLQSFVDEFYLPDERNKPFIPAKAGQVI